MENAVFVTLQAVWAEMGQGKCISEKGGGGGCSYHRRNSANATCSNDIRSSNDSRVVEFRH
jgi:hypothetical protein